MRIWTYSTLVELGDKMVVNTTDGRVAVLQNRKNLIDRAVTGSKMPVVEPDVNEVIDGTVVWAVLMVLE